MSCVSVSVLCWLVVVVVASPSSRQYFFKLNIGTKKSST